MVLLDIKKKIKNAFIFLSVSSSVKFYVFKYDILREIVIFSNFLKGVLK